MKQIIIPFVAFAVGIVVGLMARKKACSAANAKLGMNRDTEEINEKDLLKII